MEPFDLRQWSGFAAAGGDLSKPAIVDQVCIDSRRIYSSNALFVALPGKHHDGHTFVEAAAKQGASYAFVQNDFQSKTVPIHLLRVDSPLQAMQELATAYRKHLKAQVILIAGSFGKTMVKDLLENLTSQKYTVAASPESFNSQIGVPLSLFRIKHNHTLALVEAAFSFPGEAEKLNAMIQPDFSILTHIGKKHLATLGDLPATALEYGKLLQQSTPEGWRLAPRDPLWNQHSAIPEYYWNEPKGSLPHAALKEGSLASYLLQFPDGKQLVKQMNAGFSYFLDLLNMTTKAAWLLGVSSTQMIDVLQQFNIEPMRTEIWKTPQGITLINDTYCADPLSIEKAFGHYSFSSNLSRKIFVFNGLRTTGVLDHSDYACIGQSIARQKMDTLHLVNDFPTDKLIHEVKKLSPQTEIHTHQTVDDALQAAAKLAHPDDAILIKGRAKVPLDTLTHHFQNGLCNNICLINLAAVEANVATIRRKIGAQTRLMVMVKALAYGTDDVRMAKFLEQCGVDLLGVSYVDEGETLRKQGVKQQIFVINAAPYEVTKVVMGRMDVAASDSVFIEALAAESARHGVVTRVHLHIDTGMGRFGCRPEEADALAYLILSFPSLKLDGVMTHFACADTPSQDAFTHQQIALFDAVISRLEKQGIDLPWRHAANSSGMIRFELSQYNLVRIGLAAYGLYASEEVRQAMDLRLALSLQSRIVGINSCRQGDSISYGRHYTISRSTERIGVLPIGYFDGLHRNYSGKGHVMIHGQKAPMVGNICMDFMMVNLTDIPEAKIGDPVLIFGEDEYGQYLSPEELASQGKSIIHELITCLGPRIQRVFIFEEARKQR